jgi:hypothetical protein
LGEFRVRWREFVGVLGIGLGFEDLLGYFIEDFLVFCIFVGRIFKETMDDSCQNQLFYFMWVYHLFRDHLQLLFFIGDADL